MTPIDLITADEQANVNRAIERRSRASELRRHVPARHRPPMRLPRGGARRQAAEPAS